MGARRILNISSSNFCKCALLAFILGFSNFSLADIFCVSVQVELDMPPEETWEIMKDLSISDKYLPGNRRVEILSKNTSGIGAHRRIHKMKSADNYVDETVINWTEGEGFTLKLHKDDAVMAPFGRAEFTFNIDQTTLGRSLVGLTTIYEMSPGMLQADASTLSIAKHSENKLVAIAAGTKHYYETGIRPTVLERERLISEVERVGMKCS